MEQSTLEVVFDLLRNRTPVAVGFRKAVFDDENGILHLNCGRLRRRALDGIDVVALNRTSARVLSLCDGTRTIADIHASICELFPELEQSRLAEDVLKCVRNLDSRGLVTFGG